MNFTGIVLMPRTDRHFSEAFLPATLSAQTHLMDQFSVLTVCVFLSGEDVLIINQDESDCKHQNYIV